MSVQIIMKLAQERHAKKIIKIGVISASFGASACESIKRVHEKRKRRRKERREREKKQCCVSD